LPTKLTIELVPSTCWFSNLRSELSAVEWKVLKTDVARNAKYLCEVCGGKGPSWPVECHEIWEYDDTSHIQRLAGLIALCPDCHEVKHIGFAGVRGRREQALRHLMKVNGWSDSDARHYVDASFEIWARRSKHHWKLDISWLEEKYGIKIMKK
jgi:hypothetical protein